MECKHFGICGSCNFYNESYEEQLKIKEHKLKSELAPFYQGSIEVYNSPASNFRSRAEFRIWHEEGKAFYAMTNLDKNGIVKLEECPKVAPPIEEKMWEMLHLVNSSKLLSFKLFSIEFLASNLSEVLVTLIYHKKLDEDWQKEARGLEAKLDILIIGRSKAQKLVLTKESVIQMFEIEDRSYWYTYMDGGFIQPNASVNAKMITWACKQASTIQGRDMFESYCGLGNFTIPLSRYFSKILAAEVSKKSIQNAKENCKANKIDNISFVRLSSEEMSEALARKRVFHRLEGVDLDSYDFNLALVDPPRAGLDSDTLQLIAGMEHIIYISCNVATLTRDLEELCRTHEVVSAAMFDQFAYSTHMESGVFLKIKP
jgi:tRNA (uracil-5-)-methyltransferase